ncbi:MAG: hypothetical protein QG592_521, partial [Pseudomonadota bacterium]|nr:hypothetical protein [Pseudomonadota bacterium]
AAASFLKRGDSPTSDLILRKADSNTGRFGAPFLLGGAINCGGIVT